MAKIQKSVFVFIVVACYVAASPVENAKAIKEHTEVKDVDSTTTQTETTEAHAEFADREEPSSNGHGHFKGRRNPHPVLGNRKVIDEEHHREVRSPGDHHHEPHHGHKDNFHREHEHHEQRRHGH